MAEQPRIRVPARALPTMRMLLTFSDEQRGRLDSALSQQPTAAVSMNDLKTRVMSVLPADAPESGARDLVLELFSLATLARTHEYSVEAVASSVASTEQLEIAENDQSAFAEFFTRLLNSPAVRTMGKAADLANEHDKLLHTSRIVSDLTPIFDDPTEEPVGAVVMHRLRMSYWCGSDLGQVEIALTPGQLQDLSNSLDRATAKSASLEALLSRIALPAFLTEEEEVS